MTELPSTYFHKHISGSFLWDSCGIANREIIGTEGIMWCNDYPHDYGTWPHSGSWIASELDGVDAAGTELILAGNAVRIFGL
jgi:predicted TIM-barrel fold metal-dependent hydrolase